MSLLEEKALSLQNRVEAGLSAANKRDFWLGFDPTIWVSLILAVIQMFQDCKKKPDEVVKLARKPTVMARMRLRLMVRLAVRDDDQFASTVTEVVQALLDEGRATTAAEFKRLMAEAKKATV